MDNETKTTEKLENILTRFAYIYRNCKEDEAEQILKQYIAEIKDDLVSEDIQMLERENKAMFNVLLKLNYTQEQITDICNGAI